jgi:hypothetical protein
MSIVAKISTDRTGLGLADLAQRINDAHEQVVDSARTTLERAIACGKLLLEAKELVPHGEWAAWIENNFRGSARSSQAYMRVANGLPQLESAVTADLSLDQALKLLSEPKAETTLAVLADHKPIQDKKVIPAPGMRLIFDHDRGPDGHDYVAVEPSEHEHYFYVTRIQLPAGEGGIAEGLKKPIFCSFVDFTIDSMGGTATVNFGEYTEAPHAQQTFNSWLFDSVEEYRRAMRGELGGVQ